MKTFSEKSSSKDSLIRNRQRTNHKQVPVKISIPAFPGSTPLIQRKAPCPCDGGCPRCKKDTSPTGTIYAQVKPPGKRPPSKIMMCDHKQINTARIRAGNILNSVINKKLIKFLNHLKSIIDRGVTVHRVSRLPIACSLRSNFNMDTQMSALQYYSYTNKIYNHLRTIAAWIRILSPSTAQNIAVNSNGDIRCTLDKDKRSKKYGAFVTNNALPIYICQAWFETAKVDLQAAILIHEAAHLIGFSDVQYILKLSAYYPPKPVCTEGSRFTIATESAVKNPDSYAYFCTDLS